MVPCTKCLSPLSEEHFGAKKLTPCPSCGALSQVDAFPALWTPPVAVDNRRSFKREGEANCYYHHSRLATVACESCGRFLCSLCDLEIGGRSICPSCLKSARKGREISSLENERTIYERVAMALAVFPMLLIWPTILTAPAAIFISIRHWKAPGSILGRKRWKFVLASVVAAPQICGWLFVLSVIVTGL